MSEILITGAGSGFGEGTALGLAQKGHNVIAAVQTWPQVTAMREWQCVDPSCINDECLSGQSHTVLLL